MRYKIFAAIGLIWQLSNVGVAQQPRFSRFAVPQSPGVKQSPQKSPDNDVVKITSNLVQVDAVITDSHGKIVTDLKAEEVKIYEDGREQRITHFSYYDAGESAKTRDVAKPVRNPLYIPPAQLKPEDIRRTIALVVDDLGLSSESIHYAREALKKFVDQQMQPSDLVAIIRTSSGMGALQQFTSDKRQLNAAIEHVKYNARGRGGISAFEPIGSPNLARSSIVNDPYAASEDVDQFREEVFSIGTLGAVGYVIRGLHELPGRKSILLISDGFEMFKADGRSDRVFQATDRLIDLANRAAVVIYTLDARGLQTLGITAADDVSRMSIQQVQTELSIRRRNFFDSQSGPTYLAQKTGGFDIRNRNDLSKGIKRILEDQRGYYLIGYRPEESTFGSRTERRKFHHLKLEVTRSGKFTVRMRNGFLDVTDQNGFTRPQTLKQKMVRALSAPFDATGIHLQLTALFANDAQLGSFVRSALRIEPRDLTFTHEPNNIHKCVFDVMAMTFGDTGVPIDKMGKTFTVEMDDDWYKRVLREGLVYYFTVPIEKPGSYQLRMSLRDSSSERIGSASQFVEVPDLNKNQLALSGLTVAGSFMKDLGVPPVTSDPTSDANMAAQVARSDDAPENGDTESSPAVRRFTRGMVIDYGFIIYNGRQNSTTTRPQLTTQIRLYRDGKEVFIGNTTAYDGSQQTDPRRLMAGGRFLLGMGLPPGPPSRGY